MRGFLRPVSGAGGVSADALCKVLYPGMLQPGRVRSRMPLQPASRCVLQSMEAGFCIAACSTCALAELPETRIKVDLQPGRLASPEWIATRKSTKRSDAGCAAAIDQTMRDAPWTRKQVLSCPLLTALMFVLVSRVNRNLTWRCGNGDLKTGGCSAGACRALLCLIPTITQCTAQFTAQRLLLLLLP